MGKLFIRIKPIFTKGKIRIPYLSDLLRVSPIKTLIRDRVIFERSIDKYVQIFKKYRNMSDDEIFNRVNFILENNAYSKYYKEEIYSSRYLRMKARLKINVDTCSSIKFIMHLIVTLTTYGSIIAMFSGIYLLMFYQEQMLIQMS